MLLQISDRVFLNPQIIDAVIFDGPELRIYHPAAGDDEYITVGNRFVGGVCEALNIMRPAPDPEEKADDAGGEGVETTVSEMNGTVVAHFPILAQRQARNY